MSKYDHLGKPVTAEQIEGELKMLWEADEASTNASLMNLVVYSEATGSLVPNSEVVRELTREHACRAILVERNHVSDEQSTQTWITAHCHMSGGKKSVCCEQIAFLMKGKRHGRLTNTVFAHLASDLPLIFWWQGDFSSVFNDRLTAVVNRLLIDSSDFADLKASHERLRESMEEEGQFFIVQDLAWTRTYQFRLTFAKLFDDPVAQEAFPTIDSVVIETHTDHRASGYLILSWMAAQAGWQLSGNVRDGLSASSADGKAISIQLESNDDSAPLSRVKVTGDDFSLELQRKAGEGLINEEMHCGKRVIEGVTPADADSACGLVASQLSRGGRNRLYRKTLPVLRAIL